MSEQAPDEEAGPPDEEPREWLRLIESGDDPLEVLRVVGTYQRYLAAIEERAVMTAKGLGRSWKDISDALGVRRQSAWARFGPRITEMSTDVRIKEVHNLLPRPTDSTALALKCPNCGSLRVFDVEWRDDTAWVRDQDGEGQEVSLPGEVRWTCPMCKGQHQNRLEPPPRPT